MVKTLFTARQTRTGSSSLRKSTVLNKLLEKKGIARALDTRKEKREFLTQFKKELGGQRVTTGKMKGFFDKLGRNANDSISNKELRIISREILGSGRKYISPKANSSEAKTNVTSKTESQTFQRSANSNRYSSAESREVQKDNLSRQTPGINANLNTSQNNYSGQLKNSSFKSANSGAPKSLEKDEIIYNSNNLPSSKKTIWSVLKPRPRI